MVALHRARLDHAQAWQPRRAAHAGGAQRLREARCRHSAARQMTAPGGRFYGWRVVAGTFVLAVFGWGLGFYGPPVYLHAVHETRGWSLALVSAAVTAHFLVGAVVVANLPAAHR